jgi:hypothetical protein
MKKQARRKNPHAVALGRLSAQTGSPRRGGLARWASVPPEERRELMRRAALARWRRTRAR